MAKFHGDDEPVTDVVAAYKRVRDFVTDKPMGIASTARGVRFTGNHLARILEAVEIQAPKPARTQSSASSRRRSPRRLRREGAPDQPLGNEADTWHPVERAPMQWLSEVRRRRPPWP